MALKLLFGFLLRIGCRVVCTNFAFEYGVLPSVGYSKLLDDFRFITPL